MTLWVIRVDIAMSAAWSAIHNTGHYHIRLRPVCLPPSCARSANNGHSRRSSRIRASVDRATHDARSCTRRAGIPTATNLRGMCCQDAEPGFGLIAVWRKTAQGRRSADRRPSDGKIKAAACGTVGRQNRTNRSDSWRSVRESMTACGFAQLIEQSKLCAPRVFRLKLRQAQGHDRLARRCRTAAGPSRLALCTTGVAGLRP
jgi:hypothetical protein